MSMVGFIFLKRTRKLSHRQLASNDLYAYGGHGLRNLDDAVGGWLQRLGDGDFVNEVLKLSEEELTHKEELKRQGWDLCRIVDEVCRMLSVDPDNLHKKGRANGLICYLGYYKLGINGKELARYFGISRPSVSKAIKQGEKFAKENDVKLLS